MDDLWRKTKDYGDELPEEAQHSIWQIEQSVFFRFAVVLLADFKYDVIIGSLSVLLRS